MDKSLLRFNGMFLKEECVTLSKSTSAEKSSFAGNYRRFMHIKNQGQMNGHKHEVDKYMLWDSLRG